MVDADAATQQLRQCLTEGGGEAEIPNRFADRFFFFGCDHRDRRERLRALRGFALGEMHHVDGGLAVIEQFLNGLVHRGEYVVEVQGDRALGATHEGRLSSRSARQVVLEPFRVAKSGGHEQELRFRQLQQWNLPGPATIGLGVVVEFIHDHLADIGFRALAQRDIGHDFGSRSDDGGIAVDSGIARHHAHIFWAEDFAQGEEFLTHQRLDRCGVERPLATGHRDEVRGISHHRLP